MATHNAAARVGKRSLKRHQLIQLACTFDLLYSMHGDIDW